MEGLTLILLVSAQRASVSHADKWTLFDLKEPTENMVKLVKTDSERA